MSQSIFRNPFVSGAPALQGGAVGNGTLTVDRLTHFTIDQEYTVICTAVAPFTVFKVIGDLDGSVGVAQVATQFFDVDLKVFFTIQQGPTAFVIGDTFVFTVSQGTDVNQGNIDDYDELSQKNFSPGNVGTNSGDDNLRFTEAAIESHLAIQDLTYLSLLAEEEGNDVSVEYLDGTVLTAAALIEQDLTFTADTAGTVGNGISVEYEDWTPGQFASIQIQNVVYDAVNDGAAGNSIRVRYTTGAVAGSEVVSVSVLDITVQIQSGVSTANQIKAAVNGFPAAAALVTAADDGFGTNAQTAPVAFTNLVGGSDSVGEAGSEVVTVVSQAIKVKLQSGVSTATQVKAAVDSYGPAAALVNTTISGVGATAQTAPSGPTNLSGGLDTEGAPGSEVVTVTDRRIKVKFQSGNSTATQVRAAILAFPAAAALVSVSITGTAGDFQTSPVARSYLSGGCPAESFEFNTDELTLPDSFFEGSGSIIAKDLNVQGKTRVRDVATFKGRMVLDSLTAELDLSGAPVDDVQRHINNLIRKGKLLVHTNGNKVVRWTSPQLFFAADIHIAFKDTQKTNKILAADSPLTVADGESIWVTLDPASNVNLAPTIGTTVPSGIDVLRLATRIGSFLVWFDNVVQPDNHLARIGENVDYFPQILGLLEEGGTISHASSPIGQITWSSDLKIRMLGSSTVVTIPAATISLADDQVAYVELDDPVATATKGMLVAARTSADLSRNDRYWVFHRASSKVIVRNGSSLVPGEERTIGEPISDDLYAYIGSTGETDNDPDYTNADGVDAPIFIADGNNLTKGIKKLDRRAGVQQGIANQDRNIALIAGGQWSWSDTTDNLTFDADAYVSVPGLAKTRNTIQFSTQSPISLTADGQIAWVTVNRTAGAAANLNVHITSISSFTPADDAFIIAIRVGTAVIVGSTLFEDGDSGSVGSGGGSGGQGFVSIGLAGSNADYIFTGTAASYHAAADAARLSGGGILLWLAGTYTFTTTPSWREVKHIGAGRGRTTLVLNSGVTSTPNSTTNERYFEGMTFSASGASHGFTFAGGDRRLLMKDCSIGGTFRLILQNAGPHILINCDINSDTCQMDSAVVHFIDCRSTAPWYYNTTTRIISVNSSFGTTDTIGAGTGSSVFQVVGGGFGTFLNAGGITSLTNNRIVGANFSTGSPPAIMTGLFEGNTPIGANRDYYDIGNQAANFAIDFDTRQAKHLKFTLTASVSITSIGGMASGRTEVLQITQDGTGGRTLGWPGSVTWIDGFAPVFTQAAAAQTDFVSLYYDGTTIWGKHLSRAHVVMVDNIDWLEDDQAASPSVENNLRVYLFDDGSVQQLYAIIPVPTSYLPGRQLSLRARLHSPQTGNNLFFKTQATLYRPGTDALSGSTNQRTSTNGVQSTGATASAPILGTFDLTDSSGQINSVAVLPGHLIKVRIYRDTDDVLDTNTTDARMLAAAAEVLMS